MMPSSQPSHSPTRTSSKPPTAQPTSNPVSFPSSAPTLQPFAKPTSEPSNQPSQRPSIRPSAQPSAQPVLFPTSLPSAMPTGTTQLSTWFASYTGSDAASYFGATWWSSMDCVLVGREFFDGILAVSHDRGVSWTLTTQTSSPLTDVASLIATNGDTYIVAVSSAGVLYNSTNGDTWSEVVVSGVFYGVAIGSNGKSSVVWLIGFHFPKLFYRIRNGLYCGGLWKGFQDLVGICILGMDSKSNPVFLCSVEWGVN
jgi:hypothetical protein